MGPVSKKRRCYVKLRGFKQVSQLQKSIIVIPAEAGIQSYQSVLDTGLRRCDGFGEF
jgi:hypothetical protein